MEPGEVLWKIYSSTSPTMAMWTSSSCFGPSDAPPVAGRQFDLACSGGVNPPCAKVLLGKTLVPA